MAAKPGVSVTAIELSKIADCDFFGLARNTVVIVDPQEATVHLIDTNTGSGQTRPFDTPEVVRVRSLYSDDEKAQPGLKGHTLNICGSSANDLYCMVSRFKPSDGALTLVTNSSGSTVASFRLTIPYTAGRPTIPVSMSINQGTLYLMDDNGAVSTYSIKEPKEE